MKKELIDKLKIKVQTEYTMGFNHISNLREQKRDVLSKVLDPNLPEGQVRIPLLWKNIQFENAIFLTDDINIQFLTNGGAIGEQIMKNANIVAKFDDIDMDLYEQREDIVNYNALYGLAATIIDGWDNDEVQPLSDSLHPLNLIVDPKNYRGSKMRFFGVERRLNVDDLVGNKAYNQKILSEANFATSAELNKIERSNAQANNLVVQTNNDGMIDTYDHMTVFNNRKCLSTWINGRDEMIRFIDLGPLTEAERLRPTKIKYPVQLHRRKPKIGSVVGVSIADEVLVFQDNISILTNLQLLNSRINALGPDVFVDEKLGVDTAILSQGKPGGRIIPISNETGFPTQNGIFTNQVTPPSQYTDYMIQSLERRAEETTSVGRQNFGVSQSGSQTKAEIQTLQQNANQILIWISNNYLRGQKEYRTEHYRSYAKNMSPKAKKVISMFQKGKAISLELEKKDFIADGKVQVIVVSKNQETIENERDFNRLTVVANLLLPNITAEYPKNELLRLMANKSGIRDFDANKYVRESIDEVKAKANLELLNLNIEVPAPKATDNTDIYLDIYRQAMDTKAKTKAIRQYQELAEWNATKEENPTNNTPGQGNAQVLNMAMNNLNQAANTSPSTATVGTV